MKGFVTRNVHAIWMPCLSGLKVMAKVKVFVFTANMGSNVNAGTDISYPDIPPGLLTILGTEIYNNLRYEGSF